MKQIYEQFKTELLESCVPFWLEHGADREYGGLLNCLDREGKVYSEDKSVWMQGRAGWMFSYIYNHIEKKQEYLDFAKSCIDFASAHCIDTDGRMFFTVTRDGRPLRKRRYWFSETFYIIANAEYYMATGDEAYLNTAKTCFDFVYGMYLDPSTDPYKITPKSIDSTRSTKGLANSMIMLNVAAIMREADPENAARYSEIITGLIRDIRSFHKPEYKAMFESVDAHDSSVILDSAPCRVINPGHDIECAWFMLEEGMKRNDEELISFSATVFDEAFARGWDKEYGGITYFKDVLGLPVEAYEHDMKLWWPQNETVIASLMLYLRTGDEKYRDIFRMVCDYAFEKFSDREHGGEWLGYLRRDGVPTEPPCKGHTYKGPFHVMRMLAKCMVMLKEAGMV
ncbi:MAG: AGE family epimerase/isomerase [Oscillospiraceae bacterium]|nr:AGE family epimerase/isomerase [Oscillospiraceae bacterium]